MADGDSKGYSSNSNLQRNQNLMQPDVNTGQLPDQVGSQNPIAVIESNQQQMHEQHMNSSSHYDELPKVNTGLSQNVLQYKQNLIDCYQMCPKLQLEVISSASLPKGKLILINTMGLTGDDSSLREQDNPGTGLDGYTFFGTHSSVT